MVVWVLFSSYGTLNYAFFSVFFFSLFAVFIHCLASFWSFVKAVVWQPKAYFVLNFQPEKALIVFERKFQAFSSRKYSRLLTRGGRRTRGSKSNDLTWKFWNCRKPADRRCKVVLTCCLVWRNLCPKRLNVSAENLKKEHGDVWLTSILKFSFLCMTLDDKITELQGASWYHF